MTAKPFGFSLAVISRLRTRKALIFFTASFGLLFIYTSALRSSSNYWTLLPSSLPFTNRGKPRSTCSPREYSQGKWVEKPYYTRPGPLSRTRASPESPLPPLDHDLDPAHSTNGDFGGGTHLTNLTKKEDIFTFTRFKGCASSRDYWWHFAVDREERWDRFPRALNWEWVPGGRCTENLGKGAGLREWDSVEVLQDMLDQGGWLMIGDSLTENHFFSLSCLLYPHVIASPAPGQPYDKEWPQHLFLNPTSPLLLQANGGRSESLKLRIPRGFDIATTPLVTLRRVDLLWSTEELERMHRELHPEFYRVNSTFKLFGKEPVFTLSPEEYLDSFTLPLPEGNYGTMIVSTAGHWTTNLFEGYKGNARDDSEDGVQPVYGYEGLLQFFGGVIDLWADKVQSKLDASLRSGYPPPGRPTGGVTKRRVIVRAYLPGHDRCHTYRSAVDELQPIPPSWNWAKIPAYNEVFETVLNKSTSQSTPRPSYPDIHFLPIDLPGRFRPDGHVRSDCLHIMTGVGVLEGWTHYIWHYLTHEI